MDNTEPRRTVARAHSRLSRLAASAQSLTQAAPVRFTVLHEPLTEDDLLSRTIMRWPVSRRLGSLRTRE